MRAFGWRMAARAAVVMLVVAAGCGGDTTTGASGGEAPVLSVPVVDLSAVTAFYPFGYLVPATGRQSPAYEFRTYTDWLPVYSASPGTVQNVLYNAGERDWEIHTSEDGGATWLLVYDHVRNVTVATGDTVAAGDQLGIAGAYGTGGGRIELQVNHREDTGGSWVSVCPSTVGSASFNAAHQQAFAQRGTGGSSVCVADQVIP